MKAKKKIFAIIVLLVVVALVLSIFGSGISLLAGSGDKVAAEAAQGSTQETEVATEIETTTDAETANEGPSVFIQTLKAGMVISEDAQANASKIAEVINVYNVLYKDQAIANLDGNVSQEAIQKLVDAGIYFDEIDTTVESEAWSLVSVDASGIAQVIE